MTLCFIFHIKSLPPKTFSEKAAARLSALDFEKLPCPPSCMTLKPIPAVNMPKIAQSGNTSLLTIVGPQSGNKASKFERNVTATTGKFVLSVKTGNNAKKYPINCPGLQKTNVYKSSKLENAKTPERARSK